MYCKNCGKDMDPNAAICVACGFAKGTGTKYCQNCGQEVTPGAAVCTACGCALTGAAAGVVGTKSKLVAGLLGIFLGGYGIHNFYLGYTKKAVTQLVLAIVGIVLSCIGIGAIIAFGVGIWGLVDGIMILTGKINCDGQGNALKE